MYISEERSVGLKTWIIKKLEYISDADSDVLADYVLALLRTDAPEPDMRQTVIENLEDFLKNNTVSFVDEVIRTVASKAQPVIPTGPTPQVIPSIASGPSNAPYAGDPGRDGRAGGTVSRKRTFSGMHAPPPGSMSPTGRGERQMKQRRGAGGGRMGGSRAMGPPPPPPPPPFPDQSSMPFDPQQAAAAMFTLQSMGVPVPPLFEGMPPMSSPAGSQRGIRAKGRARCRDYDRKGICHRGANCPYLHDENQIIMPAPLDEHNGITPNTTISQSPQTPETRNSHANGASPRRGRRGSTHASPHSQRERSNASRGAPPGQPGATLVIAHVPEPQFNEASIRSHFSTFGLIKSITLAPDRWLAHITYEAHAAAQAAYDSPKVIFDNRFVKLYWHRPRQQHPPSDEQSSPTSAQPEFDPDAFAASTAAAQARLEQRRVLQKENDVKIAEVTKKQAELNEERKRLENELRKKAGADEPEPKSTTEALRAQLRALEQEAKSLGLEPEPWSASLRGRGGYRGRGSYRSRGTFRGLPGGGVYNLDNRPKSIRVDLVNEGESFDTEKDEALRQFLFSVAEYTAISNPGDGSQIVSFKDRPSAERFFYGTRDIPDVGKVEMAWARDDETDVRMGKGGDTEEENEVEDGGANGNKQMEERYERDDREERELDWDVAEDEDRWTR